MTTSQQALRANLPIRCLVVQMARLGDTIQSLMALRAAKHLYPDLEIHFVARERFAAAAKRVPWIKEVITFPTESLVGPVLSEKKSELDALSDLARWIGPLVKDPWDIIVNWSYSESSSFLTAILPARIKLGYSRRRDTTFYCADGWSHYIQAIVQGGIHQNIHLTDVLTTQLLTALQIHVGDPVSDGNTPVTSKGFFSLELGERDLLWNKSSSSRKWVGFQLGAGSRLKTWPAERWGKLAKYILERHPEHGIVLLGGKEDEEAAKALMQEIPKSRAKDVISLVGGTDFDLWASVVSRCQWVFAGDTAVTHLASVLGTRVLNLSIGPVRFQETGPYGNGHYVVAPAKDCLACKNILDGTLISAKPAPEHTCASDLSAEVVYGTWAYGSSEWAHRRNISVEKHFSQLGWSSHLAQARVFRSKVRNTNDGGGVVYESMAQNSIDIRDWTSQVMGHIARAWYCGWVPPVGQEFTREMISPALIQKLRELEESAQVLSKICDEARKIATQLARRSANLKSEKIMRLQERDEIQSYSTQLMDLDHLITRLGKTHAPLLGFSHMSKVLMHNLQGAQISDLGRESAESYKQIAEGVTVLREWLKHTLNLAKPVAIKSSSTTKLDSINPGKPPGNSNDKELTP